MIYFRSITATIVLSTALIGPAAHAIDLPPENQAELRGLAIAQESKKRDAGFNDSISEMEMILTNANGDVSTRKMKFKTLEVPNPEDGDKSLMVFEEPRDVAGTAMLTYSHILEADDQWMFLPALKRVKRISSVNKSGPFMGSEFAFEDLSSQEYAKYSHSWVRDEPCGELTCHVVERKPLYEHSGYTRMVSWTDSVDFLPRKIDYYDRKDQLLKTLTFSDYRLYLNKHWRAHNLFMVNHTTKKKTNLTWANFAFQTGLTEADFSQNSLKRAR